MSCFIKEPSKQPGMSISSQQVYKLTERIPETVMVKAQMAEFPEASLNVYTTVVVPTENESPGLAEEVGVTEPESVNGSRFRPRHRYSSSIQCRLDSDVARTV